MVKKFSQARSHEGDLVVLYIQRRIKPDTLGNSVMDVSRFDENGRVVE